MPANFTSGWLGNGQAAWHGLGTVTEGTLPAREAFETADALFTVDKARALLTQSHRDRIEEVGWTNYQAPTELSVLTQKQLLGVVSPVNTRLSRTIRSFGWQSSSGRRSTWTASSFYQMVPRSALPPHSVVRKRTSSLVTPSNDVSLAT